MKTYRHVCCVFPLVGAVCLLTGCASIGGSFGDLLGPEPEMVDKNVQLPPDTPSFMVELRPEGKSAEPHKFPLPEKGVYVSQILDKSRAVKRFGRVTIELWRPLPNGAGHHKLDVLFDRKHRVIPPGYDYAIRPNDRLVIMEDTTSVLDDMLESVTGPASALVR